MRTILITLLPALAIALAGCESATTPATPTPGATTWLLADMPDGAVPVRAAKASAKEGDTVVVRGRIGGRHDPLSHEVAVFVVVDPVLPDCRVKGDMCKTPWDYCCESPQTITAHSATVQLVDDGNAPMAIDLTTHGLEPLDEVVVVGTVGPRPTGETLIIKASGIHRVAG